MQERGITEKSRDDYADFLKYFLILMVVLGHFINLYQRSTGPLGGLYNCIYTFHMPLFVFLSGYFSKRMNTYRRKNIDTLLYPFIVFQIINIVYTRIIPIEPLSDNFFYPYHQNWYLIALFWWRTISPYKQFFKDYVVIGSAVLICLGVGFYPEWSGFLGLYKTAYFFPFFILGSYCEDLSKLLDRLLKHKVLWLAFLFSIMVSVMLLSFNSDALNIINYAFKADARYNNGVLSLLTRIGSIVISILMCYAVLVFTNIIYRKLNKALYRRFMLTGGGTMLAFLGHEFIMIPLIRVYSNIGSITGFLLCAATSVLVTYILTRQILVGIFSPLLDLNVLCKKIKIKVYNEQ